MLTLARATWPEIDELRNRIMTIPEGSVVDAAQHFASSFAGVFSSIVLARVFMVIPFGDLPEAEREFATGLRPADVQLTAATPVLCLLGTSGRERDWCDRKRSRGHLAIPLVNRSMVLAAPMIARLLGDLEVDLAILDVPQPIATRKMIGGHNGTFYVPDAPGARDGEGRPIIPSQEFVAANRVQTVFGMGGAYFDGALAIAICFTTEKLTRPEAERYSSFISTFKTLTTRAQMQKKLFG